MKHFDIGPYNDIYLHFGSNTTGFGLNIVLFKRFFGFTVTGKKIDLQ